MRTAARMRLLAGAVLSAAALLTGCAGVAEYSTAKLVRPGGVEASAHATGYAIAAPDEPDERYTPQLWSAGGSAAIGLARSTNLLAGYQFTRFEVEGPTDGDPVFTARDHRLSLGLKYGWDPLREAFAFAYAYHVSNRLHEATASHFTNLYWKRSLYYCVSPSVTFFTSGRKDEWFLNVVLNQSLTWEPVPHVFMRPQAGLNVLALFAGIAVVNAGMAAGLSF